MIYELSFALPAAIAEQLRLVDASDPSVRAQAGP